jgi:hypothetical protein
VKAGGKEVAPESAGVGDAKFNFNFQGHKDRVQRSEFREYGSEQRVDCPWESERGGTRLAWGGWRH